MALFKFSKRNLIFFAMNRAIEGIIIVLLITLMPGIPPPVNFSYYKVAPTIPFEGGLTLNTRLNGVERLFEKEIKGPEAFADYNGEIYTTLEGGEVCKIVGNNLVPVAKVGLPCKEAKDNSICGRPLGLNFDNDGVLYVTEAYSGIWKIDLKTGKKEQIISIDTEIEQKKPKLPNSVAISKFGDIYWTDSSHEFELHDGVFALLADGTGRLIHYNPVTKQNKVLISGLQFANGVVLSPDEEFVLVAETGKSMIHRYYLKGTKKGKTDVFIEGLPGLPDNLKNNGDGFLVPLVVAKDYYHPALLQVLGPFPLVRKFVARIFGLTEVFFGTVEKIYPNFYSKAALHIVGHFEYMMFIAPRRVSVLYINKDGMILDSLHTDDMSAHGISEVHIFKDDMYFGSPFNNYIGKLSLTKARAEHIAKDQRKTTKQQDVPKPVEEKVVKKTEPIKEAPKPTTVPAKQPPPTAAPVKKTPPPEKKPTAAPVKQPPPTAAPVKQTPPTAAPVKQPPPTAAPVKQPPPTVAPVKQPPPTVAPVKQPQPTAAPVKQPPPTAAPVKQPPSTAAPVKQPPPTPAPVKQASPPVKQSPPAPASEKAQKDTPKVVPVKEKTVPKTESIPPRK